MTRPIVAIVGRTNVGKSTLLNRLAGRRLAVVGDLAGITRDRVFAPLSWEGRELTLVDTAGWQQEPQSTLDQKVRWQVEVAIARADVIVFLVDVKGGLTAADEETADKLRAAGKPTVVAVNKVDSDKQRNEIADFYRLGIGPLIAISAYHGRGMDELMSAVLDLLPPASGPETLEEARLAIVGRPNVGKSTLLNALLGYQRAVADESPGTTRDALDARLTWDDKEILLIDTAGVKRRGSVDPGVDYYALLRALQAIERCDIALLVIDASEFVTAQDMHIAGYILEAGKGMVLVVNKWDLVPRMRWPDFKRHLEQRLRFMPYVPAVYISASLKHNTDRILPLAWQVWQGRQKRVSDSAVDMAIKKAVQDHFPPRVGARELRVVRAYQDNSRPWVFVLQVNDPRLVHFSYQRYLENRLRGEFGFFGSPLQVIFAKPEGRGRTARRQGVRR